MPYKSIADLPQSQVDQYTQHQKEAFLKAFNNALENTAPLPSLTRRPSAQARKNGANRTGRTEPLWGQLRPRPAGPAGRRCRVPRGRRSPGQAVASARALW